MHFIGETGWMQQRCSSGQANFRTTSESFYHILRKLSRGQKIRGDNHSQTVGFNCFYSNKMSSKGANQTAT